MVILNGNIQSMSNRRGKYTKVAAYYCLIGLQKISNAHRTKLRNGYKSFSTRTLAFSYWAQ